MTGRTFLRIVSAVLISVGVLATGVYFVNPLRTESYDPRLRVLGFTLYRMPSTGMEPTVRLGEILMVSAWPYRHLAPSAGDVVVFRWPVDPSVFFLKRVIATGGSTVEIADGVTIVDGRPLREPYVEESARRNDYSRKMPALQVPADSYFVMGDNRDKSDDSRNWGFVPRSRILGKVEVE